MIALLISKIIAGIVLLICLGFIAYWAAEKIQGDCLFRIIKRRREPFKVTFMDISHVELVSTLPIQNRGRQGGTLMDVFCRAYLPREQYDRARVTAALTASDAPRDDNYWESCIVPEGEQKEIMIILRLDSKSGNILRDLETFPDMPIDIIYQTVGRSDWYYAKDRVWLTAEELKNALYKHAAEGR